MKRFIPSQIDEETKIVKGLSFSDIIILIIGAAVVALILASSLPLWAKLIMVILVAVFFILAVVRFEMVKGYNLLLYGLRYMMRKKKFDDVNLEKEMNIVINDDIVQCNNVFISVVELNGVDFGILEERTQDEYIDIFASVLKEIKNGKLVKFEKPLDLSKFIDYNEDLTQLFFDKQLEEEESNLPGIQMRLEMLENQNDYLKRFQYFDRIFVEAFYLVILEQNDLSCNLAAENAVSQLARIGLMPKRLTNAGLRTFLNLYLKNNIEDYFEGENDNDANAESDVTPMQENETVEPSMDISEPEAAETNVEENVEVGSDAEPSTTQETIETADDVAELGATAEDVNASDEAIDDDAHVDSATADIEAEITSEILETSVDGDDVQEEPEAEEPKEHESTEEQDVSEEGEKPTFSDDISNSDASDVEQVNEAEPADENVVPASDSLEPIDTVSIQEKSNSILLNGQEMRVIALGKYPMFVANAWAFELFAIEGTKIVFNFSEYPSKNINKRISRTMTELNSRLNDKKAREDEKKKWLTSYQSLDALLEGLEYDNEKLFDTECYLLYPKARHREIMKFLRGKGIKINDLLWTQYDGWLSTNPLIPMPVISKRASNKKRERVSSIQSSSVAGMFPFVAKMLLDDKGFYLGASTRYPVFFNQFTKTQTRVNHNMIVFGKPGGGKSFFMKKLAMRGALEDKKIFILDPDNEYDYLCDQLHGNWIDVAGERVGRMNPLHVFASMKDNEAENVGDVASHKLFLEEFFRTVLPEMPTECRLYLNECISELYVKFEITDMSIISELKPEKFPTFTDLYNIVLQKQKDAMGEEGQLSIFRVLLMYLKQFVGDGIYARLWNGPTTLNISNDFNVLNFQSLFANNNTAIANGQMLLLMRFLNQEVIKNREINKTRKHKKHIEIWIDEAHRFINAEFPVALKFMSTMAKQIRKYDGGLIVATQNIADFVGVSEMMRAMATAVINSCQYSMIFGLLANDITQLKELYSNYNGGFTQQEIDFIGHAKQGDALFIVDINTRLPLHVELYDGEGQYIEPASMRK